MLVRVCCIFGGIYILITDRGTEFVNEIVKEVSTLMKTIKIQTTPQNPRSDGLAENAVGTFKDMLYHYCNKFKDDWDLYLNFITLVYNTTVNDATGYTPFYLMYGREAQVRPPEEVDAIMKGGLNTRWGSQLGRVMQHVWAGLEKTMSNNEERFNKRVVAPREFVPYKVGQWVYIRRIPQSTYKDQKRKERIKISRSLQARWCGPYQITRVVSPVVVEILLHGGIKRYHALNIQPAPHQLKEDHEALRITSEAPKPSITELWRMLEKMAQELHTAMKVKLKKKQQRTEAAQTETAPSPTGSPIKDLEVCPEVTVSDVDSSSDEELKNAAAPSIPAPSIPLPLSLLPAIPSPQDATPTSAPPAARRRGRPKVTQSPSSLNTGPHKRRGRPPKSPDNPVVTTTTTPAAITQRRGRPKRVSTLHARSSLPDIGSIPTSHLTPGEDARRVAFDIPTASAATSPEEDTQWDKISSNKGGGPLTKGAESKQAEKREETAKQSEKRITISIKELFGKGPRTEGAGHEKDAGEAGKPRKSKDEGTSNKGGGVTTVTSKSRSLENQV
jgi:hypothetical protein